MRTTRILAAVTAGLIATAAIAATAITTSAEAPEHVMQAHAKELAQVRRATARFHDLDAALEAGYELGWVNGSGNRIITNCVSHPTAGAMGYHYFHPELMADLAVDLLSPEVLVYEPGTDGQLHLAAVEWVARGAATNPPGLTTAPTLLGMPMHILNPAVGFYLMHAWIWRPNPAGMFTDWNPDVACP
jgi:hypothetical protein